MDQEQLRKIATTTGSAVIIIGILLFFFANDATRTISLESRVIAAFVGIVACLVALRIFFAKRKF